MYQSELGSGYFDVLNKEIHEGSSDVFVEMGSIEVEQFHRSISEEFESEGG